jgi:hypothetical protein
MEQFHIDVDGLEERPGLHREAADGVTFAKSNENEEANSLDATRLYADSRMLICLLDLVGICIKDWKAIWEHRAEVFWGGWSPRRQQAW